MVTFPQLFLRLQQFYQDHIDPDGIQPVHALRTAIAGILAIVFYRAIDWPQAYWVLASTILIIQTYLGNTPKERFGFLIFTGIISAICVYLASRLCGDPWVMAVFLMASTFICLYVAVISPNIGNVAYYINIFCLSAGALPTDALNSLHRFWCVLLGTLIAVMVCLCCWPDRPRLQMRRMIAENLQRLSDLNRTLAERITDEHAIAIRRNRMVRGLQRARELLPPEEVQDRQLLNKIEYLYEIILNLHELKQYIHEQKVLRLVRKELPVLTRRLTWLLRSMARNLKAFQHFPDSRKFLRTLQTFEKIYERHLPNFNEEQLLAFTVYIDAMHKLEKNITELLTLMKMKYYYLY